MQKVQIGRIVHYVFPDGTERPAIVTRVWSEQLGTAVQLSVQMDGTNDTHLSGDGALVVWKASVLQSETATANYFHFPDRG